MIIYSDDGWNRFPTADFLNYFKGKGQNIEVKDKKDFPIITKHPKYSMLQQLKRTIILEREDDGFILFDFDDKSYFNRLSSLMQHPKCLKVLKAQFQKGISDKDPRISPYTYWVKDPTTYRRMRTELFKEKKTENRLFYAGSTVYGREEFLKGIRKILSKNDKMNQEDYLRALSKHKVALSLPGSGNFCHRELECFGAGTLVLMPKLKNQYFDDLIPDVHYIPVTVDDVVKKYYSVLNDGSKWSTTVNNALSWFHRNIEFPANMELTEKLLC